MWQITDDFWDRWELLKPMFWRCELWQDHVQEGGFPDCDMLTLGKLGKGFGHEWETNFTHEEQITMMTLWCIFRSPMMIGTDLPQLDDWTKGLLKIIGGEPEMPVSHLSLLHSSVDSQYV